MGIFSRMRDITASNINGFKQEHESSAKNEEQVSEYIADRLVELADMKKSAEELIAIEKNLKSQLDECRSQIERFEGLAKKAVLAGNEQDAREFLKKKHQLENKHKELSEKYGQAKLNSDKIKKTYNAMVDEINNLQGRMVNLKGREAAVDAQNVLNKAVHNSDIEQSLNEWDTKTDMKEARSDAYSYSSDDLLSQEIEKLRQEQENSDSKKG